MMYDVYIVSNDLGPHETRPKILVYSYRVFIFITHYVLVAYWLPMMPWEIFATRESRVPWTGAKMAADRMS